MAGTRTEFGGFIAACAREGVELVPTLAAWAASGGPMRATDFRRLADDLVDRVRGAGSAAGVLLALHGAWVAEGEDDPDGWILARVRQAVGPDVPVVATLDLHANVTAGMVRSADALVGYRTYPHVDMPETGERAAALLFRLLHGGVRAATRFRKVPMIVPPENAQTTDGPLGEVVAAAREAESRPRVLAVSVFPVQPWLDVAELGCAVVVVGADGRIAQREADHLARMLWERRRRFQVPLLPPDEAVARALAAPDGPILLVDSADGVSSGAPGDSTAILGALVRARPQRTALVSLVDPEAARAAAAADGQEIALAVGGRLDPGRHRPISVRGRARRVHDGKVVFTAGVGDGLVADMGSAAVLEVGSLRLLVMERPVPCYDPALYRGVGLDPTAAHVVVVKSPNNFRWTYRDIARDWIYVDAPGASTPRLESLTFTRAPRPLFPFDDWAWQPERAGAVGANP
jgi:microcystin degradation protein MlrC